MKIRKIEKPGCKPYSELSEGSFSVKIYSSDYQRGGKTYTDHRLVYSLAGERVRLSFAEIDDAKREAGKVLARLNTGDQTSAQFGGRDRERYQAALDELKDGTPLAVVAREWQQATALLNGKASVLDVVKHWVATGMGDVPIKTTGEVLAEMLLTMERDNPGGERHRVTVKQRCTQFVKKFPGAIASLNNVEINAWLRSGLKCAAQTRNHYAASVALLFSYSRSAGYVSKTSDVGKDLARAKVIASPTLIYPPATVAAMLAKLQACEPDLVPMLAIMAFAGLRTAEVGRLTWADIRFESKSIELSAEKTKTASRRSVEMRPNLLAWLLPYQNRTGPVCVRPAMRKRGRITRGLEVTLREIIKNEQVIENGKQREVYPGIAWLPNAHRHGYGSYLLQITKNKSLVAGEMGNTPQMIDKHYKQLTTQAEAEAYWNIMPGGAKLATVTAISAA